MDTLSLLGEVPGPSERVGGGSHACLFTQEGASCPQNVKTIVINECLMKWSEVYHPHVPTMNELSSYCV